MSMPPNPGNDAERAEILRRDGLMIGIAVLSLLNGMHFSPLFDYVYVFFRPIASGLLITSPLLTFYLTSLLLAAATLVVAGVPAALFERWTGRSRSDAASLGIWMVATAILAIPSILGAAGFWR